MEIKGDVRKSGHKQRRWNFSLAGYVFVLPYVCALLIFGLLPMIYAVLMSVTDPAGDLAQFQGFTNYLIAFRDFRFVSVFVNIGLYLLIWLPMIIVGVLLLALLTQIRPGRFSGLMRLIYYLPGAVSGSASVILWLFMFDPSTSPFSALLHVFHWYNLADTLYAPHEPLLLAIIAFSTGAGGWIVIMYGALQSIPAETLEAAKIDGSNAWTTAFRIKLPLISKYVVYMVILCFAAGTQLFVEPQILGQASNPLVNSIWSPNLLAYEFAFTDGNLASSAAVSVMLLILGLIAAYFVVFRTGFFDNNIGRK